MSLEDRKVGVVMAVCVLHSIGEVVTSYRVARWCKCSRQWVEAPLKALVEGGVLKMEWATHRANTQKRIFEPVEIMVQRCYPEVWEHVTLSYGWPVKLPGMDAVPSRLQLLTRLDAKARAYVNRDSAPGLRPLDTRWRETLEEIFSPERLK